MPDGLDENDDLEGVSGGMSWAAYIAQQQALSNERAAADSAPDIPIPEGFDAQGIEDEAEDVGTDL